jgi:hypothetical protein
MDGSVVRKPPDSVTGYSAQELRPASDMLETIQLSTC